MMSNAMQGEATIPLFTYGGYMSTNNLLKKNVKPVRSVVGMLPAHELAVARLHPLQFTLRPSREEGVHGVIHFIAQEDENALYRDGQHEQYSAKTVRALELASGEIVNCSCFMAPANVSISILSRFDLEPVIAAGMAAGLEEFYLRQLFGKCRRH